MCLQKIFDTTSSSLCLQKHRPPHLLPKNWPPHLLPCVFKKYLPPRLLPWVYKNIGHHIFFHVFTKILVIAYSSMCLQFLMLTTILSTTSSSMCLQNIGHRIFFHVLTIPYVDKNFGYHIFFDVFTKYWPSHLLGVNNELASFLQMFTVNWNLHPPIYEL